MVRALYAVALAVIVCGCASTRVATSKGQAAPFVPWVPGQVQPTDPRDGLWSDEACAVLMQERDNWQFAAAFLSGIGGAGGIGAAAVPGDDPNNWPKWTVGTVAVVSGAAGAAAVIIATNKGADFETYCKVGEK